MLLRNTLFKAFLGMAFFFILCFSAVSVYVGHWFSSGFNEDGQGRSFLVKEGWSLQIVAQELSTQKLISHPQLFIWTTKFLGEDTNIHAGEYLISAYMSPATILKKMTDGHVILHKVTLPEGLTSAQFVQALLSIPELEGDIEDVPAEGSLLPETYTFTRGASRAQILGNMQKDMNALLDRLWASRPKDSPLKSKKELVVLASIVEKETAVPAERPIVAAVFLNRVKKGMPLQADPTVVYGITQGKQALGRTLLKSDLEKESPYNTYLKKGLPIGPIANPGKASLEAVVNPANVKYFYFVADGKGGHVFAETLAEHRNNHAAWRKIRANK